MHTCLSRIRTSCTCPHDTLSCLDLSLNHVSGKVVMEVLFGVTMSRSLTAMNLMTTISVQIANDD